MTSRLLPIAAVAAVLAGCETFTASEPDPGIEEWAGATWPDAPANAMARTTTYRMWITDNDGAIDGTIPDRGHRHDARDGFRPSAFR